ncbi:hypothetical protein LSH36_488g05043 [Paralvinella palmiformis]|uniref:CUB domain-containing protein n=1 Tax=Paralvinella palmiformis TaxID=53620 RepID=A0AAD9MYR8_9ANNE|nr:hypothetical protein LSH36_488g05043 [Paralvinella palmiformis]
MNKIDMLCRRKDFVVHLVCFVLIEVVVLCTDAKTVSQCYGGQAFSFISLYCGYKKVIQIQRAFHGVHKNAVIDHCGYLDQDCTMDTIHLYDWSKCEGKHSCVQTINPVPMIGCNQTEMTYLQVHYACVPGTAYRPSRSRTTMPRPSIMFRIPPNLANQITHLPSRDIIQRNPFIAEVTSKQPTPSVTMYEEQTNTGLNHSRTAQEVILTSPGYPEYYPTDTECRCVVKGHENTKVSVTYQDMSLVMRAGQCVDWLLLQSLGFRNSAAVTCGQMVAKEKTLMAKGSWLLLHFHTAVVDAGVSPLGVRNMKGFKVKVKSKWLIESIKGTLR